MFSYNGKCVKILGIHNSPVHSARLFYSVPPKLSEKIKVENTHSVTFNVNMSRDLSQIDTSISSQY